MKTLIKKTILLIFSLLKFLGLAPDKDHFQTDLVLEIQYNKAFQIFLAFCHSFFPIEMTP